MSGKQHPYTAAKQILQSAKTKEAKDEAKSIMRKHHPWRKLEGKAYKDGRGRWYEIRVDGHRRRRDLERAEIARNRNKGKK